MPMALGRNQVEYSQFQSFNKNIAIMKSIINLLPLVQAFLLAGSVVAAPAPAPRAADDSTGYTVIDVTTEPLTGVSSHALSQSDASVSPDAHGETVDSANWSGAVWQTSPSGSLKSISAQWNTPTASVPPGASGSGQWSMAAWVVS